MRNTGLFVLVALVVAALTFLIVDTDEQESVVDGRAGQTSSPRTTVDTPSPELTPTQDPPEAAAGFDRYRNRAGYTFDYPEAWNLDEKGTAVEIVSPDASIAMSFGVAPDGDVRNAIGTLLDALESRYEVDAVRGPTGAFVGTSNGVSVSGEGLNDNEVPIEFTAFVVEGTADNYGITVFSSQDADDSDVQAILDSFTTF